MQTQQMQGYIFLHVDFKVRACRADDWQAKRQLQITKNVFDTRPNRGDAFQVFEGFKPSRLRLPNNGVAPVVAV